MVIFASSYLPKDSDKTVREYKYKGISDGITYKKFYTHFCDYLVQFCPKWLAPNVLTTLGFLCLLIPNIILWRNYTNNLTGYVPSWLCFTSAFGHFAYIILDNCDGKQARRTGSSSPLGMIFDHQCDAVGTGLIMLNLGTVCQFGFNWMGYSIWAVVMVSFFFHNIEEYFTGCLWIREFGSDEGNTLIVTVYTISGLFGCDIWLTPLYKDIPANQILIVGFIIAAIIGSKDNICEALEVGKISILVFLYHSWSFAVVIGCLYHSLHKFDHIMPECGVAVLGIFSFLVAKIILRIQIAHICRGPFPIYNVPSLTVIGLWMICIERNIGNPYVVSNCFAILSFLMWFDCFYTTSNDFMRALNIKFWTIKNHSNQKFCLLYEP